MTASFSEPVVVVGAGIAGLCCARKLLKAGEPVIVLEASNRVGGRVQSDVVDGFTLDLGFQVLLDAYPEAESVLDYDALNLKSFGSGSYIYDGAGIKLFADPFRHPSHALSSLLNPAGTLSDKIKLLRLRGVRSRENVEQLFSHPDTSTLDAWRSYGFSEKIIGSFLRPFYQGIFLENELSTSRRMFEFTFSMFSRGHATVPASGMKAISEQLADQVRRDRIRLNSRVSRIENNEVYLESGECIQAKAVVNAHARERSDSDWNAVTCLYFKAPKAPYEGPWLALNGSGSGIVNQVAVMSNVSEDYAPNGQSLISVSVNGNPDMDDEDLYDEVKQECAPWFERCTGSWEPLMIYRIPFALPRQKTGSTPAHVPFIDESGCFTCGDHTAHASLQGAMESGRLAAEHILRT